MATLRARLLRRPFAVVIGVFVVVAIAGQLLLPPIAERVAGSEVGSDQAEIRIRAFPAWKLVFGHVDDLRVTTPTLAVDPDDLTALLRRARKVRHGEVAIGTLSVDRVPVKLRNVRATVDDGRVSASAELTISELAAQLPAGAAVTPEPPHPDGLPRLRASLTLLGVKTEIPIVVRAAEGAVEASGDSGIASAIRVTVFQNQALRVEHLRGSLDGDVMTLRIRAVLR